MIGAFGGINEEVINALQGGFELLGCRELPIRHQIEMDQSIIQNRRELMQVFMGFRPRHRQLRAQDIKCRIRFIMGVSHLLHARELNTLGAFL